MTVEMLKSEFLGLAKATRELKKLVSDLENSFYGDIQFSTDLVAIAMLEQNIFEGRKLLNNYNERITEIRSAVGLVIFSEWRKEYYANEKAVAAATTTASNWDKAFLISSEQIKQEIELKSKC